MSDTKKNLLEKILFESKAYDRFSDIEKLVENDSDLTALPIQPLYVSLLNSSTSAVAKILPRLSKEQRQSLIDLDFWNKDVVDVHSYEYWIESYSLLHNEDALVQEFIQGDDFLLYLKSRINIYTFDVEDPMYPDHDFYFLTDDQLLLVEYGEDYRYPGELKLYIQQMYTELGVEKAYAKLFKLVNDSFSLIQEESYQLKKERLREFGFVDYFEAKEKLFPFARKGQIKKFIEGKTKATGEVSIVAQNQSLHSSSLIGFDTNIEVVVDELEKVKDSKRLNYLQFTFVRMINSNITLKEGLKKGRLELKKIANQTKSYVQLGLEFVKKESESNKVFESFDFFDLYKIGASLISIEQQKVKKKLIAHNEDRSFLGAWWNSVLEMSSKDVPQAKSFLSASMAKEVRELSVYDFWSKQLHLLQELLPYIEKFEQSFKSLKNDGHLQDDFYLNYEVDVIDIESILISSFINFSLGKLDEKEKKMGLTVNELKAFIKQYGYRDNKGEYHLSNDSNASLKVKIDEFSKLMRLSAVVSFDEYLYGILSEHLSGYDFDSLDPEDFKHVGGPILFKEIIKA